MNELRLSDGFKGQKLIVLPIDFLSSAIMHPLIHSMYLTDIGFFPNAKNHYRERSEGCPQYIMIFCTGGKGFFILDNKKKTIEKDTLFIINANEPHIYGSSEKKPWSIFWVHFSGENAPHFLQGINKENPVVSLSIEKSAKLKLMFDDMIANLYNGYSFDSMIYVSQVLSNMMGFIFFAKSNLRLAQSENAVEESIRYMTAHLNKNLELQNLANTANLSKSQYGFLFKEKTGFSPIDYFIRLKIHKACQYLDTTDFTVGEIAKDLGFSDQYYFSRAFHKIVRLSPSDYRKIKKG